MEDNRLVFVKNHHQKQSGFFEKSIVLGRVETDREYKLTEIQNYFLSIEGGSYD